MNALRCLRAITRTAPTTTTPTTRAFSLLSARRPTLALPSTPSTLPIPGTTTTSLLPPTSDSTLDLASRISAHPSFANVQIRCGPRDTYNPSHIVRKRRHGFLTRLRSKKGRKLLLRRLVKGRVNLSH